MVYSSVPISCWLIVYLNTGSCLLHPLDEVCIVIVADVKVEITNEKFVVNDGGLLKSVQHV